jgi:hypothetical protein
MTERPSEEDVRQAAELAEASAELAARNISRYLEVHKAGPMGLNMVAHETEVTEAAQLSADLAAKNISRYREVSEITRRMQDETP